MFRFVLILAALSAAPAMAFPQFVAERAEVFAICSGRLSALHVRQQADRDPAAPATYGLRTEFDHLLAAVVDIASDEGMPTSQPARWRAQGWSEVANLLRQVHYNIDPSASAVAQRSLEHQMKACSDLVLPS